MNIKNNLFTLPISYYCKINYFIKLINVFNSKLYGIYLGYLDIVSEDIKKGDRW